MSKQIFSTSNQIARSTIAIIDTVSQRGGFRGDELSTIGGLRDQCSQLIAAIEQAEEAEAEEVVEAKPKAIKTKPEV
jgi:hypothetical protein